MSDPSSIGVQLPQGIPEDLVYTPKAVAPKGRAYEVELAPTNASTFAPNSVAQFNLGAGRKGTYLDGKSLTLKFDMTFTSAAEATANVAINDTAFSFIDSLVTYVGGQTIDSIQNYSDIATLLLNLGVSSSQKSALGRVIGASDNGNNAGHVINVATAGTYRRTFCLPLLSFLTSTKMMDLGDLGTDIRFDITWASTMNAISKYLNARGTPMVTNLGVDYQISNVSLIHTIVELDSAGQAMVDSMKSPTGTLYFGKSFRYSSYTIPAGATGEMVVPGNQRLSSITAALARFRTISSTSYNSRSSVNPNSLYYSWRFGSVQIPQRNVPLDQAGQCGGYSQAFRNLMACRNMWSSPAAGCALNATDDYFTHEAAAVATTGIAVQTDSTGQFALGADTEVFQNRGMLLAGTSTLANPFFLNLNVGTALTNACTVDIWAEHDVILSVGAGGVTVRI